MVKTFIRKRSSKTEANPLKEAAPAVHKMRRDPEKFMKRSQFKGLSEVRNALKISVVNKFESINLLPYSFDNDEIGSYFFDELERSHAIEQSKEWYALYTKLVPISQNLSLILLNKNQIFDELTADLDLANQRHVVFKLLLSLLRDIRGEGYQYFFEHVFEKIVDFISQHDESLEVGVQLIGGFIKYCNKAIIAHLPSFSNALVSIALADQRPKHMSRIIAEVLAYLYKRSIETEAAINILTITLTNIFTYISHMDTSNEFWENKVVYFTSCLLFETLKGHENTMDERVNLSIQIIFEVLNRIQEQFQTAKHVQNFLLVTHKSLRYVFYKLMKIEFKFVNKPRKDNAKTISDFFQLTLAHYFNRPSDFWSSVIPQLFADVIIFREGILFKDAFRSLLKNYIDKTAGQFLQPSQIYLVACCIHRFKAAPVDLTMLFSPNRMNTKELKSFVFELINHSQKIASNRSIFKEKQILTYEEFASSTSMSLEVLRELIGVTLEHFSATDNDSECLEIFYVIAFLLRSNLVTEKVHIKDQSIESKLIKLGKELCSSSATPSLADWLKDALCITAVFSVISFGSEMSRGEHLDCLSKIFQLTVSNLKSVKQMSSTQSTMENNLVHNEADYNSLDLLNLGKNSEHSMLCDLFSRTSDLLLIYKTSLQPENTNKLSDSTQKCIEKLEETLNQTLIQIKDIPQAFSIISQSQKLQKILTPATLEEYTSIAVFRLYSQKSLHRFEALSFLQSNQTYNRQFREIGFIDFLIRVN